MLEASRLPMADIEAQARELLACPFCRKKPRPFDGGPIWKREPWVTCYGRNEENGIIHAPISLPVRVWNTRPTPAVPDREEVALPDIGPDPMKTDGAREGWEERLKQAYVIQQKGVPDQCALVWRWDLGEARHNLIRNRAMAELWLEQRASPTRAQIEAEAYERAAKVAEESAASIARYPDSRDPDTRAGGKLSIAKAIATAIRSLTSEERGE